MTRSQVKWLRYAATHVPASCPTPRGIARTSWYRAMDKLEELGYVTKTPTILGAYYTITDAGRARAEGRR